MKDVSKPFLVVNDTFHFSFKLISYVLSIQLHYLISFTHIMRYVSGRLVKKKNKGKRKNIYSVHFKEMLKSKNLHE